MGTRYAAQTGNAENYTPRFVVDRVRYVFDGPIHFDPASCEEANKVIQAYEFYDKLKNGLNKPWPSHRSIFINPPYNRDTIERWADLVLKARTVGSSHIIWLSNNSTETKAVQKIMGSSSVICLPNSRMCFYNPDKPGRKTKAMQGQVICLLNRTLHLNRNEYAAVEMQRRFVESFGEIGTCFRRV